ncbi:hypothetical protein [Actinoplanes couchii]|uniref:hypothetical protein n=1 Tax=Actinoplanes couchii TaxID=403638 RepID=UPI0019413338|nr:hypothetical protein [Actinoplanes couchii]MDR6319425.1 hypothetical protein [Actinoplanes couchii]
MTRTLRTLGWWSDPGPDVCAFVHPGEPDRETAAYLRSGTPLMWRGTPWSCILCGRRNGSAVLTDGEFLWPEDLPHYLDDHGVRLPVQLRGTAPPVDADGFVFESDGAWWQAQSRDGTHLPGCPRHPALRRWNLPGPADVWIDGVPPGDVTTMARVRRLFGADWPFTTLHDRTAAQPFPIATGIDPRPWFDHPELSAYLHLATPDGLRPLRS